MNLGVSSEIGRLRKVIVHRPGIELSRLTPQNKESLLFDDILWVERAQEEHDQFVEILRSRGAEVLYFRDLLAQTMVDPDARGTVIDWVVTPRTCGRRVSDRLRHALRECDPEPMLDVLLGGLQTSELEEWGIDSVFAGVISNRYDYVLPALPNLYFMRDSAAWINQGVSLSVLATPARAQESLYMKAIYDFHPDFREAEFPYWYGHGVEDRFPASLEGGDVLVLDERTALLGCGERTTGAAVETLAHRLFDAGGIEKLIVAHFRRGRAIMHLDTVFTMVDVNKFNFCPGIVRGMETFILEPRPGGRLGVESVESLERALALCLRRDDPMVIASGDTDGIEYLREQWDDGHNTFALEPGVVVGYRRNSETNARLRDAGVEVLELDASELCRGRGGSRCMTQPILRDPVDWSR